MRLRAGIGKALARKCAEQGMSVVLVARPETLLDTAVSELTTDFPELRFRKVAVDLGTRGYAEVVEEATKDVLIQVVFLNAGYVQTGFFSKTALDRHYANLECNVGHSIALTHIFLNRYALCRLGMSLEMST